MKILAVETATSRGGVALADDDRIVGESIVADPRLQAERILPMIDELLKAAGWSVRDLDAIAVSIGPGSFTGVRIGLSTVKGLAMAANIPIIPVSTLDALGTMLAPFKGYIRPMLDARKSEVFTALYDGSGNRLGDFVVIRPEVLVEKMSAETPVLIAGEGAVRYREIFEKKLGTAMTYADEVGPRPSSVAVFGRKLFALGKAEKPETIVPVYVRKSDAELKPIV